MTVRRLAPRAVALFALFAALTLPLLPAPAFADAASDAAKVDPDAAANYAKFAHGVQAARLQDTINKLAGIRYTVPASANGPAVVANSRVAGTPGGEQAHQYVQAQFSAIFGPANVQAEPFTVTSPATRGASVSAAGRSYALQPLWPNLVRTSTLPERGIDGPLIYGGSGELRAFRGKTVEGSIVLLDFNCGTQWLNAARLGAQAIIFIEPAQTMRGEAESKFIGIPIAIPRFWITRADAAALQSAALTTPDFKVHLAADNPWTTCQAYNVIGKIPGSDPVLGKQIVVIESYFDSMSIVPHPGARRRVRLRPGRHAGARPRRSRPTRPSGPSGSSPAARTFWACRASARMWTSTSKSGSSPQQATGSAPGSTTRPCPTRAKSCSSPASI